MKKSIFFVLLFFLGFAFTRLDYADAVERCNYRPNEVAGTRECGQPNYCAGCYLVNDVTTCSTDSNSNPIASTCELLRTEVHEANSPVCAASCKPPPPVCQTITCFGVDNAGGTCSYPGSPNSNIPGCTATCPGTGKQVPGFTVSVCQTNNCYYNDCTCYPNAGECVTPTPAPNLSCPVPPTVTNVRVECPYCL